LLGHEKTPGHTVVVVGGGLCGCEVAAYLAQEGREVTLIEMADQLVPEGADVNTMLAIRALLAEAKIDVRTGTKLLEIRVDGVLAESGGKPVAIPGDTVVIATGYSPDLSVRDELEDLAPELYLVGDCTRPRNILNAIWEGFHAGRVM
jgi:2-enoate reductase